MSESADNLDRISTRWSAVHDVQFFLLRYAASVRRYLRASQTALPQAVAAPL